LGIPIILVYNLLSCPLWVPKKGISGRPKRQEKISLMKTSHNSNSKKEIGKGAYKRILPFFPEF